MIGMETLVLMWGLTLPRNIHNTQSTINNAVSSGNEDLRRTQSSLSMPMILVVLVWFFSFPTCCPDFRHGHWSQFLEPRLSTDHTHFWVVTNLGMETLVPKVSLWILYLPCSILLQASITRKGQIYKRGARHCFRACSRSL